MDDFSLIIGIGMAVLPVFSMIFGGIPICCAYHLKTNETNKKENLETVKKMIIIEAVFIASTLLCLIVGKVMYELDYSAIGVGLFTGVFIHAGLMLIMVGAILVCIISMIVYLAVSKKYKESQQKSGKIVKIMCIMTGVIICTTLVQYVLLKYGLAKYW